MKFLKFGKIILIIKNIVKNEIPYLCNILLDYVLFIIKYIHMYIWILNITYFLCVSSE